MVLSFISFMFEITKCNFYDDRIELVSTIRKKNLFWGEISSIGIEFDRIVISLKKKKNRFILNAKYEKNNELSDLFLMFSNKYDFELYDWKNDY